jgi:multidrug efflux system membrane fusion protein
MNTGTELASEGLAENKPARSSRGLSARLWIVTGLAVIALVAAWLKYSLQGGARAADALPASLPRVVVSKPLVENLDTRLSFLGQFSAVSQVELRAQVGGTLTGIFFKDGDIVQQGGLLFTIDGRPYEITLARETAQLDVATARLELAERQLDRAKDLEQSNAGTVENVDQRTSDQRAARASVEEAKARIRDAQFDLDHCRITAPFTGRIGTHLVSVGNLIAGSRTSASPTTFRDAGVARSDLLRLRYERIRFSGFLEVSRALEGITHPGGHGCGRRR